MLITFHKPYGVVSQFTPDGSPNKTLAEFNFPKDVYPIGRLDADSEGLLLLSDEKELVDKLLNPRNNHSRTYWSQVEGIPTQEAMDELQNGVVIQGYKTLPCKAKILSPQPDIPPRDPPIRYRRSVPDTWIELELTEGKNRQVRKMTAAVGFPTLRLIRVRIGELDLGDLPLGKWKELSEIERKMVLLK